MTGTIWWLWLGCTGLGVLLTLAQMFYAVQKSFGILKDRTERTKACKTGLPRLSVEKSIEDRPNPKDAKTSVDLNLDANDRKYSHTESDSDDFSEVLDQAPTRPLRWVRACSCQGACKVCNQRWMENPAYEGNPPDQSKIGGAMQKEMHESFHAMRVRTPVDLAWYSLTCQLKDKATGEVKVILQPNSGVVVPGEMCAFVGPSGAGKSTLLDILAGCRGSGQVRGVLRMNGKRLGARFKRVSAYVEQEDAFVPTMTCWETLLFHARLRTASGSTTEELRDRMERVLEVMGLLRHKTTPVGGMLPGGIFVRGLSGGEKRRLTIACALIGRPSLLFLDEPTSGLDSFAALNVMEHLSQLASLGHAVIASIHQPRTAIWDMFHKVVVLSEGYQLYFGAPEKAPTWFDWGLGYPYDPDRDGSVSDWLIDLISISFQKPKDFGERTMTTKDQVAAAAQQFLSFKANDDEDTQKLAELATIPVDEDPFPRAHVFQRWSTMYPASWWRQFVVLSQRAWYMIMRNPSDAASRSSLAVATGLLSGAIAWDLDDTVHTAGPRMGVLFFENVILSLLPFSYMSIYYADREFYARDVASGLYHPSAYYVAQSVVYFPFVAVNTLVTGFITYGMVGLRYAAYPMITYGVTLVLVSLCSTQTLIFAAYIMPTQDLAFIISTFYVCSSILLMGFFVRLDQMRVPFMYWCSYLMFPRWAFEGLLIVEMTDRIFWPQDCPDGHLKQNLPPPPPTSVFASYETRGKCYIAGRGEIAAEPWLHGYTVPQIMGILVGFLVGLHVLSYGTIAFLYKRKR
eukprot:jgi/Botrbrau1/19755/Bobra.0124s0008.1